MEDLSIGSLIKSDIFLAREVPTIGINVFPKYPIWLTKLGTTLSGFFASNKGFVNAAFWQTVAVVFGSNLKQSYEPSDKDLDMEKIVRDVEVMYGYRSAS